MKIKKIGHCCLLITIQGASKSINILTDPGAFSTSQNDISGIDIILITHEHGDHLHVDSLKAVLKNNPYAYVYTNSSVGRILTEQGIQFELLEGDSEKLGSNVYDGLKLKAYDSKHEEIFEDFGQVQNTGYMIWADQNPGAKSLFYPGDSYCNPQTPVDVLAMPVSGPWCKIPDAIRYAIEVKPKKAFPVHDSTLQPDRIGSCHSAPAQHLPQHGIEFIAMKEGDETEF